MTYEQSRRTTTAQVNQNALKALLEFNGLTYREAALRCKVSTGTIGTAWDVLSINESGGPAA